MRHRDILPGGQADDKAPRDFDRRQLLMGKKVESEHTKDRRLATEIAMDHLAEDPRYYSKLRGIHKEASVVTHTAFFDELEKIAASTHQKDLTSQDRKEFKRLHPDRVIVPGEGSRSGNGCSLGKDKDGYYVYTHRARCKSYPTIAAIPKKTVAFIGSTS